MLGRILSLMFLLCFVSCFSLLDHASKPRSMSNCLLFFKIPTRKRGRKSKGGVVSPIQFGWVQSSNPPPLFPIKLFLFTFCSAAVTSPFFHFVSTFLSYAPLSSFSLYTSQIPDSKPFHSTTFKINTYILIFIGNDAAFLLHNIFQVFKIIHQVSGNEWPYHSRTCLESTHSPA